MAGASEPPFLGVAIGHNERIAWGLTIVGTDQQDVYVEELNPANHDQVKWNGGWESIRTVREEIPVKGAAAEAVRDEVHPSRADFPRGRGAAPCVRAAFGAARARHGAVPRRPETRRRLPTAASFLDAARYWNAPSENLICGDVDGNISWRASALTPARKGWSGRLPVPGTGEFEWQGFRTDLPQELNPARGFIVTANHNVQPKGYGPPFMFKNADTRFERITRLLQLIQPGKKYLARRSPPHATRFLLAARGGGPRVVQGVVVERIRPSNVRARCCRAWDATYRRDSAEAALYEAWRAGSGRDGAAGPRSRPSRRGAGSSRPVKRSRRRLQQAIERLTRDQGRGLELHGGGDGCTCGHFRIRSSPPSTFPAVERGGGAGTVAADGASYREIFDVADWDRSLVINTPGQSGQPGSPFYSNLVRDWADEKYFPLAFSRPAVEKATAHRLTLTR